MDLGGYYLPDEKAACHTAQSDALTTPLPLSVKGINTTLSFS